MLQAERPQQVADRAASWQGVWQLGAPARQQASQLRD
jgi:hypothetical protein